jgi:hypothetical protein
MVEVDVDVSLLMIRRIWVTEIQGDENVLVKWEQMISSFPWWRAMKSDLRVIGGEVTKGRFHSCVVPRFYPDADLSFLIHFPRPPFASLIAHGNAMMRESKVLSKWVILWMSAKRRYSMTSDFPYLMTAPHPMSLPLNLHRLVQVFAHLSVNIDVVP